MPATDALTQVLRAADHIWDNAKLYPQDGGIVVLIPHADYCELGAALERVRRNVEKRTHRSVVVHRSERAPGSLMTSHHTSTGDPAHPDAPSALGSQPELGQTPEFPVS